MLAEEGKDWQVSRDAARGGMLPGVGCFAVAQAVDLLLYLVRIWPVLPAVLLKCFLDCRNVSVEQCRTAAGMNNS